MKLSERIARDGITVESDMIRSGDYGHYEWDVRLHRPDGRSMHLHDYSSADEPTALDVMDILLSVASRVEGTGSYEEWASEFESDPEKWQDEETYDLQRAEVEKLRRFLGSGSLNLYLYSTDKGV